MSFTHDSPTDRTPTFRSLGLSRALCSAVAKAGYTDPTPIQVAAIPSVLDGRDLLGCAQTGSGKTAAFALPILHQLRDTRPRRNSGVRALVLAPTRELAAQIGECFANYGSGSPLRHLVVFGGVNKNPQVRALRTPPDILVACPGRLLDLMQNDGLCLRDVEHVVLDEADRMLDMGFIHDVRKVVAALPDDRQTLLFSATMPTEIEKLARRILVDPERVAVDPISSTAPPITQSVYFVGTKQKQAALTALLRSEDVERALVFTRTKHGANRVAQKLERANITAAAIHGNKSQGARERAMAGFRSGDRRVIVATDLASRGIDVKHLSHVFNFDLPNIAETYVHRVGRTGRAGASGVAISLCADDERAYLRDIEKLTGNRLERRHIDDLELPELPPAPEPARGSRPARGGRMQGRGAGEGRSSRRPKRGTGRDPEETPRAKPTKKPRRGRTREDRADNPPRTGDERRGCHSAGRGAGDSRQTRERREAGGRHEDQRDPRSASDRRRRRPPRQESRTDGPRTAVGRAEGEGRQSTAPRGARGAATRAPMEGALLVAGSERPPEAPRRRRRRER